MPEPVYRLRTGKISGSEPGPGCVASRAVAVVEPITQIRATGPPEPEAAVMA